jgi:DNA repair protein RecO (recombination protein O)
MTMMVKGLIIKETKVGEGDKIITILTPELGIIQAAAKGARSYKSKFLAGCQLFCYTSFALSKKSKWYSLLSAEPVHTFYEIRTSLGKLSLATYFCDLLCEVCTDSHQADKALKLALNTLYMLSQNDCLSQIKATFELRFISDSGFTPELYCCVKCGSKGSFANFCANDGGLLCEKCAVGKSNILIGTLSAMRYIISAKPKRVFSYKADEKVLSELEVLAENYALCQIGRCPRSLKYYHKMNMHSDFILQSSLK